jgi:hypothetical protein
MVLVFDCVLCHSYELVSVVGRVPIFFVLVGPDPRCCSLIMMKVCHGGLMCVRADSLTPSAFSSFIDFPRKTHLEQQGLLSTIDVALPCLSPCPLALSSSSIAVIISCSFNRLFHTSIHPSILDSLIHSPIPPVAHSIRTPRTDS